MAFNLFDFARFDENFVQPQPSSCFTHCSFCQSDRHSLLVTISRNRFLNLYLQEINGSLQKKKLLWFCNPQKQVQAVDVYKENLLVVLVTRDASLYILPALPIFDSTSQSQRNPSQCDLVEIKLKLPQSTKPTTVACWRSIYRDKDVILVGTEAGEVAVIDVSLKKEITRVRVGDAVVSLEIVKHGKNLVYLLISTVSGVQFNLLLERQATEVPSLTSSMTVEASELQYDVVQSMETAICILDHHASSQAFKPIRFDQFMKTVHLSCQTLKGRQAVVARCFLSNVLKVYDGSIDNWMPLFVYNIPRRAEKVLLTDHFIFSVSKDDGKLSILSSQYSETSDRDHSDALLQEFEIPLTEQVIGIFCRHFQKSEKRKVSQNSVYVNLRDQEEFTNEDLKSWCPSDTESSAFDDTQYSSLEGCIIVSDKNLYQVNPRVIAEEYFSQLLAEGEDKAAEILGVTLELNMSHLYLQTAESKLAAGSVYEAMKFFRQARTTSLVRATLLIKYNFMEEAISSLESSLTKQGELNHEQCKKVAEMTISCLVLLWIRDGSKTKEIREKLETFLMDNFDYNVETAIKILAENELWTTMLYMARVRGHLLLAMETLLNQAAFPLSHDIFQLLQSAAFLPTFVRAGEGAFLRKLPPSEGITLVLSKPELTLSNLQYVSDSLPHLSILNLIKVAQLVDPTSPFNLPAFSADRGRAVSSSSVSSTGSFYGDGNDTRRFSEFVLPDGIDIIRCFISVLLMLSKRRRQKDYGPSQEPGPGDLDGRGCLDLESSGTKCKLKRNLVGCGKNHAAVVTSGELYTWGKSHHGRLGHGSILPKEGWSPPLRVETLHMHHLQVIAFSCGKEHSVALTSTGSLYTWGNSKFGQLGTGETLCHTHPVLIDSLVGRFCVEVVCGQYHTLARTSESRVYSWGWGIHGQLGHGDPNDQCSPKLITALSQETITQIGAGACHSGALSVQGKLWMFGCNTFGQLGTKTTEKSSTPIQSPALGGERVKLFACGYFHNVAVTTGKPEGIFTWGHSPLALRQMLQDARKSRSQSRRHKGKYRERLPGQQKHYLDPQKISSKLESGIMKVVCGCNHTLMLTASGDLYSWGRNILGQLGLSNKVSVKSPSLIPFFASQAIADMAAGSDFSIAVNHYGEVFTWGSSEYNQLGHSLSARGRRGSEPTIQPVYQPAKVQAVPLVTIPAEFMMTDLPDSMPDEKELYQNSSNMDKAKESDLGPLIKCLGTSTLAQPNNSGLLYSFASSKLVYAHLRGFYQGKDVLSQCVNDGLWDEAAELACLEEDYILSLRYNLKKILHMRDVDGKIEKTLETASYHLGLIQNRLTLMALGPKEKAEITDQFLKEIFQSWIQNSFAVDLLEKFFADHLKILAPHLAIYLFSPYKEVNSTSSEILPIRRKFSTSFCLKLTNEVVSCIKQGHFIHDMGNLLDSEVSNATARLTPTNSPLSPSVSYSSLPENVIMEEVDRKRANNIGTSSIIVSSEDVAKLVSCGKSVKDRQEELRVVVFSCGHHKLHSQFFHKDLVEFDSHLKVLSDVQLPKSAALIQRLYHKERDLIPVACSQCVLMEIQSEVDSG